MSKRLPYYQSEPAEYLAGDIMYCTYASQGVFTILRALYWQKDCEITLTQAKKRIINAEKELEELVYEGIIKVVNDDIEINFLDEQYAERTKLSKVYSENGLIGAKKRWEKHNKDKGCIANLEKKDSQSIATLEKSDGKSIAFREEKRREEKISTLSKDKEIDFDLFWNKYDKKIGREKTHKKFTALKDSEIKAILAVVDNYVKNTPDLQYRKNPSTWLNGKHWEDEVRVNPFSQIETLDVKRNQNHLKAQNYLVLKQKEYLDNGVEWTNELGGKFYKEGLAL